MSTITAPAGRVIVTLDAAEETIGEHGLIIPENKRKPSLKAVVVSSGYDAVKQGDRVLLLGENNGGYPGASVKFDGVDYVSVIPEEILAVLA